ncbi:hypothetical protein NP233_g11204 [Leucocoprinus birnbaumii]|uniref:Transmembrane protein n=1 Tax=Leucocoprinus birnbaumii TaxID=56174 RepID=A0AAD5YP65_9AGAR|nr:hypothetical protein NP233_g11204 [Leucocoprinus birnbaumii]
MEQAGFSEHLSLGLGSATLATTLARIVIRARSLDAVQRRTYWALPQLLSDGLIMAGTAAQLCTTVLMIVVSPTKNSDDHDQARRLLLTNIVISYLTIWFAKASVACAIIGGGRRGADRTSSRQRWRLFELGGNLLFYTGLWVGIMSQNIKACSSGPNDSLNEQYLLPKAVGVAHVVVYPIATTWLVCNASWALAIHSRMDDSLWRVFWFAVGGDLLCTSISVVRGAKIIAGNFEDAVPLGIIEAGLAIPIVNLQILLPKLYNPCAELCRRVSSPPSSVDFACRVPTPLPSGDIDELELEERSINTTPKLRPGDIDLLTIPSSPISPSSPSSPSTSIAGSTSYLLPRMT